MHHSRFHHAAQISTLLLLSTGVVAQEPTGLIARAFQPGYSVFSEPYPATDFITAFEKQAYLAGWRTTRWTDWQDYISPWIGQETADRAKYRLVGWRNPRTGEEAVMAFEYRTPESYAPRARGRKAAGIDPPSPDLGRLHQEIAFAPYPITALGFGPGLFALMLGVAGWMRLPRPHHRRQHPAEWWTAAAAAVAVGFIAGVIRLGPVLKDVISDCSAETGMALLATSALGVGAAILPARRCPSKRRGLFGIVAALAGLAYAACALPQIAIFANVFTRTEVLGCLASVVSTTVWAGLIGQALGKKPATRHTA